MSHRQPEPKFGLTRGVALLRDPLLNKGTAFTDPERDPLQAELFEDPPKIANGRLTLKEAPGLGLALSERAVKKFGERIL